MACNKHGPQRVVRIAAARDADLLEGADGIGDAASAHGNAGATQRPGEHEEVR
jgi:hypothetical protein